MDELGKAGYMRTAEFGARSAVAEDAMPTGAKLLGETEKSASFVGDGNPRDALAPVRTAELFLGTLGH